MKTWDHGPFCFVGIIAAIVAFVVIPISCATTNPDLGYSDQDCTRPQQSIDGTVVQTCYVNAVDGFSMCRYRVVNTPVGCQCREWRARFSCDGQWEKIKRKCVCDGG